MPTTSSPNANTSSTSSSSSSYSLPSPDSRGGGYYAIRTGRSVRACIFLYNDDGFQSQVADFGNAEYDVFAEWKDAVAYAKSAGPLVKSNEGSKFGDDGDPGSGGRDDDESGPPVAAGRDFSTVGEGGSGAVNKDEFRLKVRTEEGSGVEETFTVGAEDDYNEHDDRRCPLSSSSHVVDASEEATSIECERETAVPSSRVSDQLREGDQDVVPLSSLVGQSSLLPHAEEKTKVAPKERKSKRNRTEDSEDENADNDCDDDVENREEETKEVRQVVIVLKKNVVPQHQKSTGRKKKGERVSSSAKVQEGATGVRRKKKGNSIAPKWAAVRDSKRAKPPTANSENGGENEENGDEEGAADRASIDSDTANKQSPSGAVTVAKKRQRRNPRKPTQKWESMLERLRQYKLRHGHTNVGKKLGDDEDSENERNSTDDDGATTELHQWTIEQRREYKKMKEGTQHSCMFDKKVDMLKALGFDFGYYSFEERLEQIRLYREEHGNCDDIPIDHPVLGRWIPPIRRKLKLYAEGRKEANLTERQVEQLKSLGLEPKSKIEKGISPEEENEKWECFFRQLLSYKAENGDCLVPPQKTDFGKWVQKQRSEYKKILCGKESTYLTTTRVIRLTDAGFAFFQRSRAVPWEVRMDQLRKYKEEHGNLEVPRRLKGLGDFVQHTRANHRRYLEGKPSGPLTEERIEQLTEMGFVWLAGPSRDSSLPGAVNVLSWEERFEELKAFKGMHGHTAVPRHYPGLGQWVHRQRVNYKHMKKGRKTSLSLEKMAKLDGIGFLVDATAMRGSQISSEDFRLVTWEERFEELKAFKEIHGHTIVPRHFPGLGQWVHRQRINYKHMMTKGRKTSFTLDKMIKLGDIGFAFDATAMRGNGNPAKQGD